MCHLVRSAASACMGHHRVSIIVDHAFLLLLAMSVGSIRVCHALRRSSEMAVISSSPSVMLLSAKVPDVTNMALPYCECGLSMAKCIPGMLGRMSSGLR